MPFNSLLKNFLFVKGCSNNSIKFNNSDKISLIGDFKKDLGPLGGVLSAMKWVKDHNKNYQWIATFPVDTPFFRKEILEEFNEIESNKPDPVIKSFFEKELKISFLVIGIIKSRPKKSVAKPGIIKRMAANVRAAPDTIS